MGIRVLAPAVALCLAACGGSSSPTWTVVAQHLPSAMTSVWGTTPDDVYIVGGDTGGGQGPDVEHFDGTAWTRLPTGQTAGDLWWVFGFAGGPVYMGGDGGVILRYESGVFTKMTTPGVDTVFGIWGASPDDVWAVGGASGGADGGFAWRLQGGGNTFVAAAGFPAGIASQNAVWKMYGRAANDAWMIGTNGIAVRWDGTSLTEMDTGVGESLFTVHADATRYVAVGGFGGGTIVENDGSGWKDASPSNSHGFIGVCMSADGDFAVGQEGDVFQRGNSGWTKVSTGISVDASFHSVWIDPSGDVWTVGGQVLTLPLTDGIVVHQGTKVPEGIE